MNEFNEWINLQAESTVSGKFWELEIVTSRIREFTAIRLHKCSFLNSGF